jgi:hypothetical protein
MYSKLNVMFLLHWNTWIQWSFNIPQPGTAICMLEKIKNKVDSHTKQSDIMLTLKTQYQYEMLQSEVNLIKHHVLIFADDFAELLV